MFIYKITVNKKVYIGFDTKPEYKQSRWKSHCREAIKGSKRKIHVAMREAGIENCSYEVVESGFSSLPELAIAEINYIKGYDSFTNGLNSSPGGDGLGKHDLTLFGWTDLVKIKEALGNFWLDYNIKKWQNTSEEDRKQMTSHLHNEQIYQKKSTTLKKYYEANPDSKKIKGEILSKWRNDNKDLVKEMNKKNGLVGAMKVAKPVIVETLDGQIKFFASRSDFFRSTGLYYSTLVDKSKKGMYYKGYIIKEIV